MTLIKKYRFFVTLCLLAVFIAVLAIILSFSPRYSVPGVFSHSHQFRNADFGMSKDEIILLEENKIIDDSPEYVDYLRYENPQSILGYETLTIYNFENGVFKIGSYLILPCFEGNEASVQAQTDAFVSNITQKFTNSFGEPKVSDYGYKYWIVDDVKISIKSCVGANYQMDNIEIFFENSHT